MIEALATGPTPKEYVRVLHLRNNIAVPSIRTRAFAAGTALAAKCTRSSGPETLWRWPKVANGRQRSRNPAVMVSDKVFLEQERYGEHVSAYCEGSHDGSHRGPCRRGVGCGRGRRTILGAVRDEPRLRLGAVQD